MYTYYRSGQGAESRERNKAGAIELGLERANPSKSNPDRVILGQRRLAFKKGLDRLSEPRLFVLDIGGRIQPYRHLLGDREDTYVALDLQLEGLIDVVATGESLPFADNQFDLVICTQMLSYVANPAGVVFEARRVLKCGGAMFLSAPAWYPEHHDECWRILPGGYRVLFEDWSDVEILPEGNSAVGVLRTLAIEVGEKCQGTVMAAISRRFVIPGLNRIAEMMVGRSMNSSMVANYSVLATK